MQGSVESHESPQSTVGLSLPEYFCHVIAHHSHKVSLFVGLVLGSSIDTCLVGSELPTGRLSIDLSSSLDDSNHSFFISSP